MEETTMVQIREAIEGMPVEISISYREMGKVLAAASIGTSLAIAGAVTARYAYTKRLRPWIAEKSTKNTEK